MDTPTGASGTKEAKEISNYTAVDSPAEEFNPRTPDEVAADSYTETTPETGNVNRKSKRGLFISIGAAAAGAALAAGAIFGVNAINNDHETPGTETSDTTGEAPVVPEEAKTFVEVFSDRYTNPVATYYAEAAYIEKGLGDIVIGDEYIESYNFDSRVFDNGEVSPLQFPVLKLDPNKEVNAENFVEFFNESTPTLNRLLNLLAKNPTPEQVAVIRDEFVKYSGIDSPVAATNLVDRLLAVTTQYGSAANYKINPATTDWDASEQNNSIYTGVNPGIDAVDDSGYITMFSGNVQLSIAIESFSDTNQVTTTTEVVDNFQYTVNRAIGYDPGNIGYVGVGIK